MTNQLRKAIYRRDGFGCALCDCTKTLQVHHYIPRGKGGNDSPHNLIALCMYCHALAHGNDLNDAGMTEDDAELAIVEYLSDMYAPDWNPYS